MIRFIHISDTHIGPTKDFASHSVVTYPCTEKIVRYLNNLKDKPDFILHTGDVAEFSADDASFQHAREVLGMFHYPTYYATGNHDSSSLVKQYLNMGEKKPFGSDESKNAYYFDMDDYRFIILDGKGPEKINPHGSMSDDQFEALEKELKNGSKPLIISIHFPLFPLDCLWLNENMLLLEGDRLHQLLVTYQKRIVGVFFGHIHRGMQIVKDDIFYSSVASPCLQFQWQPAQKDVIIESTGRAYYNYVAIKDNQVTVKEYSIPNGTEEFVKTI